MTEMGKPLPSGVVGQHTWSKKKKKAMSKKHKSSAHSVVKARKAIKKAKKKSDKKFSKAHSGEVKAYKKERKGNKKISKKIGILSLFGNKRGWGFKDSARKAHDKVYSAWKKKVKE